MLNIFLIKLGFFCSKVVCKACKCQIVAVSFQVIIFFTNFAAETSCSVR